MSNMVIKAESLVKKKKEKLSNKPKNYQIKIKLMNKSKYKRRLSNLIQMINNKKWRMKNLFQVK